MSHIAVITGAGGGVGSALARILGAEGWSLALVSRQRQRLEAFAGRHDVCLVEADVSTPEGAELAIAAARERFGAAPDGLAHCAGTTLIAPLHRTGSEQYRDCMRANLDSAFYTLGAFVKGCLEAKQPGSAVLVASVVARLGVANHEAITAAKAGVEALARAAAATYSAHGIRVNAVLPGLMRTAATERLFSAPQAEKQLSAQYPLKRHGVPEDAAAAMAWLLSDRAAWITGQSLPVDGGFTAVRPLVRA